jgi:hypothetical protein
MKIADYKMDEYIHHVAAFNAYEGSTDANSVKARFQHFSGLLTEVRYHKMFEVQKAVEKMVAVPMPFLVNEVFAMWSSSPKDQASLSIILKHVKDDVDVPVFVCTPSKSDADKGKDDKGDKSKQDKKGSNWRSKGRDWRGRDSNQDSGKSQSSDKRRNDNQGWRSRRITEYGKGSGNGSTRDNGRDNRRDNSNATRA